MDWLAELHKRAEVAKEMARDVPAALSADDLTVERAARLYQVLGKYSQTIEALIEQMEAAQAERYLIDLAKAIAGIFDELARVAADGMVELRKKQ